MEVINGIINGSSDQSVLVNIFVETDFFLQDLFYEQGFVL